MNTGLPVGLLKQGWCPTTSQTGAGLAPRRRQSGYQTLFAHPMGEVLGPRQQRSRPSATRERWFDTRFTSLSTRGSHLGRCPHRSPDQNAATRPISPLFAYAVTMQPRPLRRGSLSGPDRSGPARIRARRPSCSTPTTPRVVDAMASPGAAAQDPWTAPASATWWWPSGTTSPLPDVGPAGASTAPNRHGMPATRSP